MTIGKEFFSSLLVYAKPGHADPQETIEKHNHKEHEGYSQRAQSVVS